MPTPLQIQIIELLHKHFPRGIDPIGATPAGTLTDFAAELGCTKEYVRLVLLNQGVTGTLGPRRKFFHRPCPICGELFLPSPATRKTCSRKCGGIFRRGVRGPNPGAWAFDDMHLSCPVCDIAFIHTAQQQSNRSRNIYNGMILTPNAPACCNRSCAVRLGKAKGNIADARLSYAIEFDLEPEENLSECCFQPVDPDIKRCPKCGAGA